jgi:hypothetical protein
MLGTYLDVAVTFLLRGLIRDRGLLASWVTPGRDAVRYYDLIISQS